MRLFLVASVLVILTATALSLSLITLSVEGFEFLYSEEALTLTPGYTQSANVRSYWSYNVIRMRLLGVAMFMVKPLGVSADVLPTEHQNEQAQAFLEWLLPIDSDVLLSYEEPHRIDTDNRRPSYIWLPVEYENEKVYILFNYATLLNGYGELQLEDFITEEYRTLLETAYQYGKENELGYRSDVILPEPPQPAVSTSREAWDTTVYITDTGNRYHRWGCQYLRLSYTATKLSTAKERGYTPCSVCNPPR